MANIQRDAGGDDADRRSGGVVPTPDFSARGERDIWTVRPPLRSILPMLLIGGIVSAILFSYAGDIVQALVNATYPRWPWTEAGVISAWNWARILAFLPLAMVVPAIVRLKSHSWTLTSQRLIHRHGILVRTADEVALHRIRDFRLIRPLMHLLLGIGIVHVVSRDETSPLLDVGPLAAPGQRLEGIREAMLAHQQELGYREYEAH